MVLVIQLVTAEPNLGDSERVRLVVITIIKPNPNVISLVKYYGCTGKARYKDDYTTKRCS